MQGVDNMYEEKSDEDKEWKAEMIDKHNQEVGEGRAG